MHRYEVTSNSKSSHKLCWTDQLWVWIWACLRWAIYLSIASRQPPYTIPIDVIDPDVSVVMGDCNQTLTGGNGQSERQTFFTKVKEGQLWPWQMHFHSILSVCKLIIPFYISIQYCLSANLLFLFTFNYTNRVILFKIICGRYMPISSISNNPLFFYKKQNCKKPTSTKIVQFFEMIEIHCNKMTLW